MHMLILLIRFQHNFIEEKMKYNEHKIHDMKRSDIEEIVNEYVVGFRAKRNRKLLLLRWCDGLTFEELAEELDMSVSQVKKITYEYEKVLCKHLRVED